jgi:D-threo-aldose 1-dehydrogenase
MSLPTVLLGDARIRTTSLGFGCAGLFRVSDPSQRLHLLRTAYDMGIRHFDVAPMYGLGRAERELGSFAKARRDELTIVTKFGIKPTIIGQGLGYAQRPIRRIFAARPSIREQARAAAGPTRLASEPSRLLYELGGYDAAGAKRSLERSLRALNTDHVDLFLLHEPIPGSVRTDELSSYLEEARRAGLIRTWGIAGEPKPTSEVAKSFHGCVPVRQLRDDIFIRSLNCVPNGTVPITYGVISRAVASITNYVNASEDTSNRWQELTGTNCGNRDNVASFLLRAALRANGPGVVLFSTTSPSHIRSAASDLQMFHRSEDPALDSFAALVDAELRESHNVGGKAS